MASLGEKEAAIRALFASCTQAEEKYEKIIELGRRAPRLSPEYRTQEALVPGCQSALYLRSYLVEGKIFFEADCDSLISKGLAALVISVYSGERPEILLTSPPSFLEATGIPAHLSPTRAGGLASIHLRMKQEALKALLLPKTSFKEGSP